MDTIENIIPQEIRYIIKYNDFKNYIDNTFDMPDKTVALLVKLLENNNGKLSKNKRTKEFVLLNDKQVAAIELAYNKIFTL